MQEIVRRRSSIADFAYYKKFTVNSGNSGGKFKHNQQTNLQK